MSTETGNDFNRFTQMDCIGFLEEIIWKNKPRCPYCQSQHYTRLKNEKRYRCNSCHTAYSVTVNTLFHDTRLPLKKWFSALNMLLYVNKEVSSRELAQILDINKNTAWYLMRRIENGLSKTHDRQLILSIMEKLRGQNEE